MFLKLLHEIKRASDYGLCTLCLFCLLQFTLQAQSENHNYKVHTVVAGETFKSISKIYKVDPEKLAEYNNLDYYEGALISKTLRIPAKTESKKEHIKKESLTTAENNTRDTSSGAQTTEIRATPVAKSNKKVSATTESKTTTTIASKGKDKSVQDAKESTKQTYSVPAYQPVYEAKQEKPFPNLLMPLLIISGGVLLLIAGLYLYKITSRR